MLFLLGFLLPFFTPTTILLLTSFVFFLYYIYKYIKEKQSFWERKGINYVKPKFLVGNIEIIRTKSLAELLQELYNEFPEDRYHGIYLLFEPVLLIKNANLIKQITVKEFDHFVDRRVFTVFSTDADPFWSRTLFVSQGERWRDLRATLSPSFTSSKMKVMFNLIDEIAQQFVDYFKNEQPEVVELEMKSTITRFTSDVIATTAFGIKINTLEDRNNEFFLIGNEATDMGLTRMLRVFAHTISPNLSGFLGIKIIPNKIANYFTGLIEDTVKTREDNKIVRPDMIHLLMEAKKGRQHQEEDLKVSEGFSTVSESDMIKNRHKKEITIDDIVSQAFIFFVAGFDTVSTCLTFFLYELAVNPDVQERLRREIEVPDKITYEALLSLKYLDMVISEVLRKWPPVVAADRKVTKAFTIRPERPEEKPVYLKEGLSCWLPIFAIHRDPKFYPDPEKFDPERFSDENKHKIDLSTYLPFGAGPRNCIGSRFALLECKLLIYHILRNFEIVVVKKTQVPVILNPNQLNLDAKNGMWLGLRTLK